MSLSRSGRRSLIALILALLFLLSGDPAGSQAAPGIQVELNSQKRLWLRITLRSLARSRLTLDREKLPWGSKYSMILVAVTPDGRRLDVDPSFDDPGFEKVSLEANESLSGDINLQNAIKGLGDQVRKSDVHLFWAYKAPEELHIARWSGGWILIPQQK